ncbi:MAG: PAS domain S-box protein, partial [Methanobacteriota archaeon]
TAKRLVGNRTYVPDPDLDKTLDTILRERSSIVVQNPRSDRMLRYLFIDLSDPDYSADMSLVVELAYDNARIERALADLVMAHTAIAVIVILAASLAALVVSRRLTLPIQAIVTDVDTIARGDLDHRVSPTMGREFEILESSIDAMVQQLKQTIEQLRASEQRYRAVVEDQTELVTRYTQDGTHIFANEAYCRYFGKTYDQIVGKRAVSGIPNEDRERVRAFFATLTPDHPVGVIEHRFVMENGEIRWQQWSDRATFDAAGKVTEYLSVGRDITERIRAEEDLKRLYEELERRVDERTAELAVANRELESFSYTVSHDLRAPLRAIDGYSRILLDEHADVLTPETRAYLEKVRANTQAMSLLIDDLLNFSRTGRQSLAKVTVNPNDLVRNALEGLRHDQEGRSIEIVVGDLPSCQADPTMLRQVFHNLLSNALKFTRTREEARIEIGSYEEDGHTVYYVRDNGIGFDMAYAQKIFGVFQRLHPQQEYEGTGVGLAIVKRIIERHGGACCVDSAVDGGTTFFFTLEGSTFDAGR